jgi:ABC-type proline/glycine betaine transport system permease subunit
MVECMSGLHQPHDKIVKATFSDIPTARAFLQAELPVSLVPLLAGARSANVFSTVGYALR